MSVAIQVSPELKLRLQQKAEQAGLNIERYLNLLLEDKKSKQPKFPHGTKAIEAALLEKINIGFSKEFWSIYTDLIKKRDEVRLTADEHHELIKISNEIEAANAERMKYLIQLAQIKKMDLDELMAKLGITPVSHA